MLNHMVNYNQNLDLAFSALGHPIRRGILARLAGGEATVADLAKPYRVSAPAISKHLHILEKAGFLSRHKIGRAHHCRLKAKRMKEASLWLERYLIFWEESFDRLDDYLKEIQSKEKKNDPKK